MKLIIVALVAVVCVGQVSAILRLNQIVPGDWPIAHRHGEYAKDRDDCRFGYRLFGSQVIQVLNCTRENPNVFYSLMGKVCAFATASETCDSTPLLDEEDNDVVADSDCSAVQKGVAPEPSNCIRWLQCDGDGITRFGRKACARGQYFSSESYQCEWMWRSDIDGTISALNEADMCGNRPIPDNRRRNNGIIMDKCWGRWADETFRVSEPVNCQFYYKCSTFSPANVDRTVVGRCEGNNLWSDSQQRCVAVQELTSMERTSCSV